MGGARVLIVTRRLNYLNPTWGLILDALRARSDVFVTGPGFGRGYATYGELTKSLGRFDVVIADPWVVNPDLNVAYYGSFRPIGITEAGLPVIVNLMVQDPHAFTESFYQQYIAPFQFALVAAGGSQFWKNSFEDAYAREPWLKPGYLTEHPSAMDDRFLLFPHCVHEREFVRPHGRRPIDASIPGVKYCFRTQAEQVLSGERDIRSVLNSSFLSRRVATAALNKFASRHLPIVPLARYLFRRTLERSLCGITCDGSVGYAVRKFFEIPAAGAVLIGRNFHGARELGFINGDNSILLRDEDINDLPEIIRWLKGDSRAAMQLASRGQDMVRQHHTVGRRAEQIMMVVDAVACRTLRTIQWRDAEVIMVDGRCA